MKEAVQQNAEYAAMQAEYDSVSRLDFNRCRECGDRIPEATTECDDCIYDFLAKIEDLEP